MLLLALLLFMLLIVLHYSCCFCLVLFICMLFGFFVQFKKRLKLSFGGKECASGFVVCL